MFQIRWTHIAVLAACPLLIILICCFGPIQSDTLYTMSGFGYDIRPGRFPGLATIDPNNGMISYALGKRAVIEWLAGRLPLWNHYEGLGAPLLGEMQSAALFPLNVLLLLPHGQEIEQSLLQLVGGLGAFLFFRRFGLIPLAALTGALLFEANGVFAWLRNAIFNPVAFLPWLFLCVESLFIHAADASGLGRRLGSVAMGAAAGALALYAGFPEETYLYGLLVLVWAGFRFIRLPAASRLRFTVDLGLTGVLALALAAPVLLAFVSFLPEGATGQHDAGFQDWVIHPAALLQYLAPYVYGLILEVEDPPTWNNIGGYLGFAPVLAAAAALRLGDRRDAKGVLLAWIVIALGASQGWPLIHGAFMLLPLTKLAACYRYLNASWIFAGIFLTALFIDRAPALPPDTLRRLGWTAAGAGFVVTAGAVAAGWPVAKEIWMGPQHHVPFIGSFAIMAALLAAFVIAGYLRPAWAARGIALVLVAETTVWFFVPFLSYPRAARLDTEAIAFLQRNVGYSRVTGFSGHGIGPNYGGVFGIPSFNYNDLPVPRATIDYLQRNLDPAAGLAFMWPESGEVERLKAFRAKLPAYARAGVKYVLADANFNIREPLTLPPESPGHDLAVGEVIETAFTAADPTLAGLTVIVNNRARDAAGRLKTTACAVNRCVSAEARIEMAQNGRPLLFAFPDMLPVSVGEPVTVLIERVDGTGRVAAALREINGEAAPVLGVIPLRSQLPVYAGPSMAIYELPAARPYFSAPGCTLETVSWNGVKADCTAPATLTRLEVHMRGWSALVNGVAAPIGREDSTFQTVPLPAGRSEVVFDYRPAGFDQAIAAALGALLIVAAFAVGSRAWRRPVRDEKSSNAIT